MNRCVGLFLMGNCLAHGVAKREIAIVSACKDCEFLRKGKA